MKQCVGVQRQSGTLRNRNTHGLHRDAVSASVQLQGLLLFPSTSYYRAACRGGQYAAPTRSGRTATVNQRPEVDATTAASHPQLALVLSLNSPRPSPRPAPPRRRSSTPPSPSVSSPKERGSVVPQLAGLSRKPPHEVLAALRPDPRTLQLLVRRQRVSPKSGGLNTLWKGTLIYYPFLYQHRRADVEKHNDLKRLNL